MNRATTSLIRRASAKATSLPSASLPTSSLPSSASSCCVLADVTQQQQQQWRSFSSSQPKQQKNVTPSAADRRLAGRRRFYKRVGIAPTSPPEKETDGKNNDGTSVQSPISAGVDGTQSATGVTTAISNSDRWSSLLKTNGATTSTSTTTQQQQQRQQQNWHTVTLDSRPLRTPLGLPLTLPSLPLALAIASEWDAQLKYLQPAQMPLMTLACTAIDQVASDPSAHREDVLRYLGNDTSCYWSDPEEDRVLHRKQSRAWNDLHSGVSRRVLGLPEDVGPAQAVGGGDAILLSRKSKGNSMVGLPHPPLLVERARRWVEGLDAWRLAALYSACAESKSFFIGAALVHDAMKGGEDGEEEVAKAAGGGGGGSRDGKWAANASRIEEEFNIECWGLVEGGHDYDRLNCSIQMHAASFLARTAV